MRSGKTRSMMRLIGMSVCAMLFFAGAATAQVVRYVDDDAPAGGDGLAWATAYKYLQDALAGGGTEIRVGQGTYWPDRNELNPAGTGDRDARFQLNNGMSLLGGYAGFDAVSPDDRDTVLYTSILSGDLSGNDVASFINMEENSYHVLWMPSGCSFCTETATVDGLTIKGGNADGAGTTDMRGAGIFNDISDAIISNLIITGNKCNLVGAGMFSVAKYSSILNCQFDGNKSLNEGGGLALFANTGALDIMGTQFNNNEALAGGGVFIFGNSAVTFTSCSWTNNSGKALFIDRNTTVGCGSTTLTLCDFNGNVGGLHSDCPLVATSCNFIGNTDTAVSGFGLDLTDCMFDGNSAQDGGALAGIGRYELCQFNNNSATRNGGATFFGNSTVNEFIDCTFNLNSSLQQGGAVWLSDTAEVSFSGGSFSGNTAPEGGAIHNTNGMIRGETTVGLPDFVYNAGRLAPGFAMPGQEIGTVDINGTYVQVDFDFPSFNKSMLNIELAGTIPGVSHDQLDAGGGVVQFDGGGLRIDVIDGFEPSIGQQFKVINAGSITGNLKLARVPAMNAGRSFQTTQLTDGIYVDVVALPKKISFSSGGLVGLAAPASDLTLGDLDNDGDLDLLVTIPDPVSNFNDGTMSIYLNLGDDGSGNWLGFSGVPTVLDVGRDPQEVLSAHLNGDAFLDVVVAHGIVGEVHVFHNSGLGDAVITNIQTLGSMPGANLLADRITLTANAADILVASTGIDDVNHLVNDGSGSFSMGDEFQSNRSSHAIAATDMNNDGHEDMIVVRGVFSLPLSKESRIHTFLYDPLAGSFGSVVNVPVPRNTVDIALMDINQDTFMDIVTIGNFFRTSSFVVNNADGTGSMTLDYGFSFDESPVSFAMADFDQDLDDDMAVIVDLAGGGSALQVIRNDTNAGNVNTYVDPVTIPTAGNPGLMIHGDIDGDGLEDIILLSQSVPLKNKSSSGVSSFIEVLLNTSNLVPCPADSNSDSQVNVTDLLAMLAAWGPCPAPCAPDSNTDGQVNVTDLLALLGAWEPCP